jgi:hypothetical protein
VQTALWRFLAEALGHAFEQMMAPVSRKHDGFAPFGHQRSRLPLKCDMADHFAPVVSGHHGNELAAVDRVPVAVRRENLRVHIVMAIDFEEAARDSRRIAFLRQIDDIVARRRRWGRRGQRRVNRRGMRLAVPGQATVKGDLPSIDSMRVAGDAGVAADAAGKRRRNIRESRMAMQQDPGLDVSVRAHQRDASTLERRSPRADCQPGLGDIVRDKAGHGRGHALGERCLSDEGAHEFASRGLERELQFRDSLMGRRFQVMPY